MGKIVTGLNEPNKISNFYPSDDRWNIEYLPMKVSTAMECGAAIAIEITSNTTTWYFTLMWTENAAWKDFKGILMEPIAATDDDYATAWKLKGVAVPKTLYAEAFFTVWAWTFTAIDVGKTVQFASTSLTLDVDTAWLGARITWYISSTRWTCNFSLPTTETA